MLYAAPRSAGDGLATVGGFSEMTATASVTCTIDSSTGWGSGTTSMSCDSDFETASSSCSSAAGDDERWRFRGWGVESSSVDCKRCKYAYWIAEGRELDYIVGVFFVSVLTLQGVRLCRVDDLATSTISMFH